MDRVAVFAVGLGRTRYGVMDTALVKDKRRQAHLMEEQQASTFHQRVYA